MPDMARSGGDRHVLLDLLAFLCIGGSGAVGFIALSSLAAALGTGLPGWLTNGLSYAVMILPVYLLHRRFSFGSKAPHVQALPRYVGVQLFSVLLVALFSFVVHGLFDMPAVGASTIVAGLTAAVNFVVLRGWAFAHRGAVVAAASEYPLLASP
jgi:putative flippase GtrA